MGILFEVTIFPLEVSPDAGHNCNRNMYIPPPLRVVRTPKSWEKIMKRPEDSTDSSLLMKSLCLLRFGTSPSFFLFLNSANHYEIESAVEII